MNKTVVIVFSFGILSLFLQCLSLSTLGWLQMNEDRKTVTGQSHATIKVGLWQIEICGAENGNVTTSAICVTMSRSSPEKVLAEDAGDKGHGAINISQTQRGKGTTHNTNGIIIQLDTGQQLEPSTSMCRDRKRTIEGPAEPAMHYQGQKRRGPIQFQASLDVALGDFDILPYLAVIAFCSSIWGLAVFLFKFSSCCSKVETCCSNAEIRVEIASMLFWLIAVFLLVPTVIIGGRLNLSLSIIIKMASLMDMYETQPAGYNESLKMSVIFPYSVMLSGIGMAFCFVNTAAIVLDKRSTDYWKYERVHLSEDHEKVELMSDVE